MKSLRVLPRVWLSVIACMVMVGCGGQDGGESNQSPSPNMTPSTIPPVTAPAATVPNSAPVANADATSIVGTNPVTIRVLDNDVDETTTSLTVVAVTPGAHGTVNLNPDATLTYTPALGFNGTDTFTYTIRNMAGLTATATVSVTITDPRQSALPAPSRPTTPPISPPSTETPATPLRNAPPTANADTVNTMRNEAITLPVLDNDFDNAPTTPTMVAVTQGAHGTVILNANATLTYTPAPGFSGTDTFLYTIRDAEGLDATATVTVTVTQVNTPPVAVDDTAGTKVNAPVTINVRANDSDADGDQLAIVAMTQGTRGTVRHDGATITYTPSTGFVGTDTFTYTISDGQGGTASATVATTVTSTNSAPVAQPDTIVADEGVTNLTIPVLANDTDPDRDTLTIAQLFTQNTQGRVTQAGANVTYTPPTATFHGIDTFGYRVCDNGTPALCDSATVTVTLRLVNDAPVVVSPLTPVQVNANAPNRQIDLTPIFRDADGDVLSVTVASNTNPSLLTAAVSGMTLTLSFQRNQHGSAVVTLRATDTVGASVDAAFMVTVTPVNNKPVVRQPSDRMNMVGEQVQALQLVATDVDNPGNVCTGCTLTVSGLPAHLLLDPASGMITGATAYTAFTQGVAGGPLYTVTVTATDPAGLASEPVSFTWRITQGEIGSSGDGGESAGGGGSSGDAGAEGEAGDGADFSPIPGAICRFLDLRGVVRAIDVTDGPTSPTPGRYFLSVPPDLDGFVECYPGDEDANHNNVRDPREDINKNGRLDAARPDLAFATFVTTRGLKSGEILKKQDVSPRTEVLRKTVTTLAQTAPASDFVALKARFTREIAGLGIRELKDATGEITSFAVSSMPADPQSQDTTVAVFTATQLFLAAFVEGTSEATQARPTVPRSVFRDQLEAQLQGPADGAQLESLGVDARRSPTLAKVLRTSLDAEERQLGVTRAEAVRRGKIKVKVTDAGKPPKPISGAFVEARDEAGSVIDREIADNKGEATLSINLPEGSRSTAATARITVSAARPGLQPAQQTVTVVAVGIVDVHLTLKP